MFLGGLMENKYPVYHWRVKSHWLSGTTSFDDVYIALPDLELARDFIQAHVWLHYATSDIRVATSVSLMNIIPQVETSLRRTAWKVKPFGANKMYWTCTLLFVIIG